MASPSTSLSVTLAHAISYLTSCLHGHIAPCSITKLQLVLEANLTAYYAPAWNPSEPLRGSGRRCLTLGPDCLPPRVIYAACIASGVQWFDWINALGGQEFDFFVDPGCVSVRVGKKGDPTCRLVTVWADELPSPTVAPLPFKPSGSKTIAQQLMEYDDDDSEHMFAMIAHETSPTTTWMSSILDQFPYPRSSSPLSTSSTASVSSTHSRSSSRSSNSSSGFSFDSYSSTSSSATVSSAHSSNKHSASRRERARQARVFIDTTKTEVTAYEGGRTTVLTGGVMLGGAPPKSRKVIPKSFQNASAMDWRASRA
ncbi:serine-rich protein [Moniliophthora roreri MCA 2997]|uniref:Serine-rich protein n=2 Tax=Moniliophthora roreri TaxID=221103 RepID=V2XXI7_MONRO|nr:serine-rich protein [Moniliophthora roreri MCA 2997]